MEICPACGVEYLRDFEVETIGLKETSRRCSNVRCGAKLKDTVLDWEDALPPKEMNPAEKHCRTADVVLCLGTSLQITPACNLPLKSLRGGGKIAIVNLQKTPKDKKASLVIHGLVDKVIAGVMEFLNLKIPPFVRIDLLQIVLTQILSADRKYVNWTLRVGSVHGQKAPLPFVKYVEVSFSDRQDLKEATLDKQPFLLKRRTVKAKPVEVTLRLNLSDGCGCSYIQINLPVDYKLSPNSINCDKEVVFQKLRTRALEDPSCGQKAIIERRVMSSPRREVLVYALVTNVIGFGKASKPLEAAFKTNGDLPKREIGFTCWQIPRKRRKHLSHKAKL